MKTPSLTAPPTLRLDKWLWAARFFKTRSLAQQAIERGRVSVNGAEAKPSRDVRAGDRVVLRDPPYTRVLDVRAVAEQRRGAPEAQALYEETADSRAERERLQQQRRDEPALAREQGRPTKHDRRELAQWDRWSASLDDGD